MSMAKDSVKEVVPYLHAVTVIPNEKIFEIVDKKTPLEKALEVVNRSLADGLEGLIETIYETGNINIDFADVKTILENGKEGRKLTYINTIVASLDEGPQQIVKRAVSNPLSPYDINKAKGVVFNVSGGKDIGLADFSSIAENISQFTDDSAKIILGTMEKKKLKGKVKLFLLATGCESDFLKKELEENADAKNVEKKSATVKKTQQKKKTKNSAKKTADKKEPEQKSEEKSKPLSEEDDSKISVISSNNNHNDTEKKDQIDSELEEIQKEEDKWEKPAFLKD